MSRGGYLPGTREEVRAKIASWLERVMVAAGYPIRGGQGRLADDADVSRETINSILGQKVDPDAETLAKLARTCRAPVPLVEWHFSEQGGPLERLRPEEWIVEAQAYLERAKWLLREQASERQRAADETAGAHVIGGDAETKAAAGKKRKRAG